MAYETLEIERAGPVTRVWLARPERRNALNGRALEEIADCFGELQGDYATRVVVLGGRGPSFCAGADRRDPPGAEVLAGDSGASPRQRRRASQLGSRARAAVEALEVPTVARLQGHVVGGGFVLATSCDFRVAAEGASFHLPEVELGLPLTWGAAPRLLREVGPARARELILLCERIDAARALDWGLLNRVVPEAGLDAQVDALASRLAALPEIAVHMTLTQLRGYAATVALGDATEADGDLLFAASTGAAARRSFGAD